MGQGRRHVGSGNRPLWKKIRVGHPYPPWNGNQWSENFQAIVCQYGAEQYQLGHSSEVQNI